MLGTGIGFSSGSQTEESEREFELSGLENEKVLEIMGGNAKRKIALILELIAERNAEYVAEMTSLIEAEGADCFTCRKGFLPGVVLARNGLQKAGVFSHNKFCSGRCLRIYKEKYPKHRCKACKKAFNKPERPTDPVLAQRWKQRPFFEAGYCSNNCHKKADQGYCKHCGKAYQISKVNYLPKHKKIIEVQEDGFCSLRCDSKGEREGADMKESTEIQVQCESEHIFDVPKKHVGFIAICPDCVERVHIELVS